MIQSLISLDDNQIDVVLATVTQWCKERDITVDSPMGRRAITAVVEVMGSDRMENFDATLKARLDALA